MRRACAHAGRASTTKLGGAAENFSSEIVSRGHLGAGMLVARRGHDKHALRARGTGEGKPVLQLIFRITTQGVNKPIRNGNEKGRMNESRNSETKRKN